MLRYLLLTPGYLGHDGVSRLSRETLLALAEREKEALDAWSLGDVPATELMGRPLVIRGARGRKGLLVAWSLMELRRASPGLVVVVMHAHLAPLAYPLARKGARLFVMLLGVEVWKPLTYLQAKAFHRSTALISISAHSAKRFQEANPGFPAAIVCYPGLPELETMDGKPARPPFALMVGRISTEERYKGHDLLIDLWPRVLAEVKGARLLITGEGDDRPRLMERVRSEGLSDHIQFQGTVSETELNRLYAECAFFVMPSQGEGFGLVFLEAMRSAKPCVGAAGAASEIIDDGTTGFIVDPARPEELRSALVRLFLEPGLRERMGKSGRERYSRYFTRAHFRERLFTVLESS